MTEFSVPMPKSSLKRSQKPIRKRKHGQVRVGRATGVVRLTGAALKALRRACWERDKGICQECGGITFWWPHFDGDPFAYDMAHVKSRGSGGSDTLANVRTLCHQCHMKQHAKGRKIDQQAASEGA